MRAADLQLELALLLQRMQVDSLDQLAKLVADLFAFIALKGLV